MVKDRCDTGGSVQVRVVGREGMKWFQKKHSLNILVMHLEDRV
jgi:hypothetical protein